MIALLLWLAASEGRPLFYWGARAPLITAGTAEPASEAARITELHAARDAASLIVRFSFDRAVRGALYLPGGAPVSGRLQAVLYLDSDDDRATGYDAGTRDLRTGADQRLDLGVLALAADPDEKRPARALLTVGLAALTRDGRQRSLWRADDEAAPDSVSAHGEWVEVKWPATLTGATGRLRLILAEGDSTWDGRLP